MIHEYFIIRLCELGYLQRQHTDVINPRFDWSIDFAHMFVTYDAAKNYIEFEKLPVGRYQIEKIIENI